MEELKNPFLFWPVLIIANLLMYVVNMVISFWWAQTKHLKSLKVTGLDVKTSVITLVINIIIAIPGYYLFSINKIMFTNHYFVRDLLLLIIAFDFAMYGLHYLSHIMWPLNIIHKNHHAHKYFNEFSLYVMHPMEAVFFGTLLTLFTYLFSFNMYSFLGFIFFNYLYGVIAHLNIRSPKQPMVFGNSTFHAEHHEKSNCNYGFYTVIWDKLFKTNS